jgi:signal transduction histidine kinase
MRVRRLQSLQYLWASMSQSLRTKFVVVIVVFQFTVMGLVTFVVEKRQQAIIMQESQGRAQTLAANLAALSEGYLLSYNFVKLMQLAEKAAEEQDVEYAVIHLHNGQVAASSGHPEKQGSTLNDAISRQALLTDTLLVQEITTADGGGRGYDVSLPVFAQGGTRKWGTVRIGFSLVRAMNEIRKTRNDLIFLGIVAVVLGTGGAIFLALRISKPIQQLVTGVEEMTKKNYNHAIAVTSRDEIGHLARRFEEMRVALQSHITDLAEEKQLLERANQTLKKTQNQLIQQEKLAAVGKLAARVAHEINNPLAIIITSLDVLEGESLSGETHTEDLLVIKEEIDRIARIVTQLLDFSRPPSDVVVLSVNDLIQQLIKFMEKRLTKHNVQVILELSSEEPLVQISPDHLKQVLLNLVKNAQEAMPSGGTLRIRTVRCRGKVTISIIDNGVGIAEAHLRSLFEPFFSTKKHGEGMGLGLSVSYSLIKSYGGAIEPESRLGHGSTFRIVLTEYVPAIQWERLPNHDKLLHSG